MDVPEDLSTDYPESLTVSVKNPGNMFRQDAAIVFDVRKLKDKSSLFNPNAFIVWTGEQELASQIVDMNGDGAADALVAIADFEVKESKRLALLYRQGGEKIRNYPKRTQAELSRKTGGFFAGQKYIGGQFENVQSLELPPEHTNHSEFIRYEGPGWESDKVGYRFYLDWRNAIDVFGKKVQESVLQHVGLDGFDSYLEMADWGMDILKVGESLGIGSIGMWHEGKAQRVAETEKVTCDILSNGPVYSQIQTRYSGWKVGPGKYDLTSDLSITAGSRMTKHMLKINGQPENLCTGLVKHEEARLLMPEKKNGAWTYLALYGKQSLAGDQLGMAVLYRGEDLIEITEDEFSHVVVLNPKDGRLMYYFLAAWENEMNGITSEEDFVQYLKRTLSELNSPLKISY